MMKRLLAATDLSARSATAVQRAMQLAHQHRASVVLFHVVDEDLPLAIAKSKAEQAKEHLRRTWEAKFAGLGVALDVHVRIGVPHREIVAAAKHRADLVVVGTPRRDILRQTFTGTTAERVLRLAGVPVLLARQPAGRPYRRILAAVDFSTHSEHAVECAQRLGLLEGATLTIVHAFVPIAEGLMHYANVGQARIKEHLDDNRQEAKQRIKQFLQRPGLRAIAAHTPVATVAAKGYPFEVIERSIQHRGGDLAVIGSGGAGVARRLLFGSVTEEALRKLTCDVLAVPMKRR